MTPNDYKTVFEVSARSFPWSALVTPAGLVVLGCILFRLSKREIVKAVGGVLVVLGGVFLVILSVEVSSNFNEVRRAYRSGQTNVVEGPIESFRPVPFIGPAIESFSVNGVEFSYNVLDTTSCFNDSFPHRAQIRPGEVVRLHYDIGCIQRVEIRTDSLPSDKDREADANAEETARNQFLKTDPRIYLMNLSVTFVALVISLCLNLDWRHYIRYWLKREPPYPRSWEIGFRVFFLLWFLGAAMNLFRLLSERSRSIAEYKQVAYQSLVFIGFFFLLDVFIRWRLRVRKAAPEGSPQSSPGK